MNVPHVDPLWDMELFVFIAHTVWWMSGLLLYILLNKGANCLECCAPVSRGNTTKVFVVGPDVYLTISEYDGMTKKISELSILTRK